MLLVSKPLLLSAFERAGPLLPSRPFNFPSHPCFFTFPRMLEVGRWARRRFVVAVLFLAGASMVLLQLRTQPSSPAVATLPWPALAGRALPTRLGPYDLQAACQHATAVILKTAAPAPPDSSTPAVEDDGGPHASHRLYQALGLARDPATNVVVVALVSVQYYDVALNWIRWMHKANATNVLLLALDRGSEARLLAEDLRGMVVLPVAPGAALDRRAVPIFTLRYYIFTYALCLGLNVVMSDIDAIWLRDPVQPLMLSAPHDDCVFSGDGMPQELRAKWNVSTTLCFGFFFCRGNERALALAAAGEKYLVSRQDDQVALNYGLDELAVDGWAGGGLVPDPAWPDASVPRDIYTYYERSFRGVTAGPVKLAFNIVARSIVTRHCGTSFHASTWPGLVAHCIVSQNATEKEQVLRGNGLWP